jgi:hypothetical protein
MKRNIYISLDAFELVLADESQPRNFMAAAQP